MDRVAAAAARRELRLSTQKVSEQEGPYTRFHYLFQFSPVLAPNEL